MITIQKTVNEIVEQSTLFREALYEGIVNFSALARQLLPRIEKKHLTKVSEGAVIMALKRSAEQLKSRRLVLKEHYKVTNMTVRSNLAEYAFRNSPNINSIHLKLIKKAEEIDGAFVNFAQGVFESTIILSDVLVPYIESLTKKEILIGKFHSLASISVKLPANAAVTPGLYYVFFRVLALEGITMIEMISDFSELTFIFRESDIDHAFTVLKSVSSV